MNDRQSANARTYSLLKALRPAGLILAALAGLAAAGLISSCRSMPVVPGRVEAVDGIPEWEKIREQLSPQCGELILIADFPEGEIREQARRDLSILCSQYRSGKKGSQAEPTGTEEAERVLIDAELREGSFMKDLKMRRSVSLLLTVRNGKGESLARYICCLEGGRTIESAPWLYRLLERGFGKLFP